MNDDGLGLVAPGASVRDLDTGLAQMASWHQSRGTADVTHLVIGENLSGGTTGLAYTSQICDSTWSVGIIEDREAWQFTTETLTHELGHNLGSSHDKGRAGTLCDSSKYIMASHGCMDSSTCPWQDRGWKGWSSCSRQAINTKLQDLVYQGNNCLRQGAGAAVGGSTASGTSVARYTTIPASVVCTSGACCDTSTGYVIRTCVCVSAVCYRYLVFSGPFRSSNVSTLLQLQQGTHD